MNFTRYAQDAGAFVNEVAEELGCPDDQQKAGRILRATLHAFRDQSTPTEMMQLVAQLPMFIKAMFVDGWKMTAKGNRVRHLDDFNALVRALNPTHAEHDFPTDDQTSNAIAAVFRVICAHVSDGELEDLWRTLPEEIQPLLTSFWQDSH